MSAMTVVAGHVRTHRSCAETLASPQKVVMIHIYMRLENDNNIRAIDHTPR